MTIIGHFELLFASASKRVYVLVPFHGANQTHFHNKGLAIRLVLKQRHKVTRKWPDISFHYLMIKFVFSQPRLNQAEELIKN